jgi:eukaryotic-like serine/threonine-protein kinase
VLPPGTFVDQRYLVAELVGRGGMADVFRAVDTVTSSPVALKLLRGTNPNDACRFESEVKVLGMLDHPGVARLQGAGTHHGVPYLVIDFVQGPSLADELVDHPLGFERSLTVGFQIGEALGQAHQLGIVHRDVKPSNVLVEASGRFRLADFGIARLADATRLTAAGAVVGSAPYIAPEQLLGQGEGPAADVYGLGLVLIECLTGERAFPGGQVEAAMARLQREPAVPDDVPTWLRGALKLMTARDPTGRPSADAVADAMRQRSLDGLQPPTARQAVGVVVTTAAAATATATAPSPPAVPSGAGGRAPIFASVGASARLSLLVVLLAALLVVGWSAGRPDPASTAPTEPSSAPTSAVTTTSLPVEPAPASTPGPGPGPAPPPPGPGDHDHPAPPGPNHRGQDGERRDSQGDGDEGDGDGDEGDDDD